MNTTQPSLILTVFNTVAGLSAQKTDAIARALAAAGCRLSDIDWLASGKAAELKVWTDHPPADIRGCLAGIADVDVIIGLFSPERRKKLLLADMDATIVIGETLDELARYAGLEQTVAAITQKAMNGEINFIQALHERVALLKGLSVSAIGETLNGMRYSVGARTLVKTMKAHGAVCALVSGGFKQFTAQVKQHLGFDHDFGNHLDMDQEKLTGTVQEPILDRTAKRRILYELTAHYGLTVEQTLCVGDGANDIPMLLAAGLGISYYAKPHVIDAVPNTIRYSDLTGLLFAQGYREADLRY